MNETEYAKLTGVNWSSLRHIATSPRLYKWRTTHPAEQTAAMAMGSAIHCAILEPETFGERYAIFEGTRRGKEWDRWQIDNFGVTSLRPDEMERIREAVKAVHAHPVASALLNAGGMVEVAAEWTDPETGLACKGRFDFLRPNGVIELKSAADVSPRGFSMNAARMLYHAQLAFYHFGAIEADLIRPDAELPYIIAVQSDEPYDVAVYRLSVGDLAAGRAVCVELMDTLMACAAVDFWPGVAPELLAFDLPKWARGADAIAVEVENV